MAGDFEFGRCSVIIPVSLVKVSCARKVCFACIRSQTKRGFDSCLRQCYALRRTVETKVVKLVMNRRKLAIRLEKRWVMRHRLVQQVCGPQQIGFLTTGKTPSQKEVLRTTVEIERGEIGCYWTLDGQFL